MLNSADCIYPPEFPQGEVGFIADLKEVKVLTPQWECGALPSKNDLDLSNGINLKKNFPDSEELLVSIYQHLERFFVANKLDVKSDKTISLTTQEDSKLENEDFRLDVKNNEIILFAGTTEGIRRGLYFFESELAASQGKFLPIGVINKKSWLKNRISRCFFGPIKRPPFNIDELTNDIDYYPEAYLDRLASEGVNGLWLTIKFKEICRTSFLPEDKLAKTRLRKLNATVEKCRKFGIKIWAFAIEPAGWNNDNICPDEYKDMVGPKINELTSTFCPNSEISQKYLYQSTNSLFTDVPNLGGLLLISHGERPTSCLSHCSPLSEGIMPCPRCSKHSIGENFAKVLTPMKQGMKDANKNAEIISWIYQPYPNQPDSWIYELPTKLDKDIAMAYNFESGCSKEQLGKIRNGGDYWLSCIGPTDRFGRMAQAAKGHCSFAAKIQVGCSHEVATIPFVPTPGILYNKYKEMKKLGVEHVLQCWYFGNYPGIMNRAAGSLGYEDFSSDKTEFLTRLAKSEWGKYAEDVANVWETLEEGYKNYPLGYEFQYYGPMHDGVVWPLHLKTAFKRLPRTWKPERDAAGDAIGECLLNFNINEAVILTSEMSRLWSLGVEKMKTIMEHFKDNKERIADFSVMKALDCQFTSGANILKFYLLRNQMINSSLSVAENLLTLERLKNLAKKEIKVSEELLLLCKNDARLGYHSEAEVYKYFPAKLQWRIDELNRLLDVDFKEIESEIKSNKSPEEILVNENQPYSTGKLYKSETFAWEAKVNDENLEIYLHGSKKENCDYDAIAIFLTDKLVSLRFNMIKFNVLTETTSKLLGVRFENIAVENKNKFSAKWIIPLTLFNENNCCRIGFQRTTIANNLHEHENYPNGVYDNDVRLQFEYYSPERMKRINF